MKRNGNEKEAKEYLYNFEYTSYIPKCIKGTVDITLIILALLIQVNVLQINGIFVIIWEDLQISFDR